VCREERWQGSRLPAGPKCLEYEAISAGIENDLGSGSNVDLCVVKNGGRAVDYLRGYAKENVRVYRKPTGHVFARGTTAVLAQELRKYVQVTRVVSDL
jgi:20S proteasome subunit beta 2